MCVVGSGRQRRGELVAPTGTLVRTAPASAAAAALRCDSLREWLGFARSFLLGSAFVCVFLFQVWFRWQAVFGHFVFSLVSFSIAVMDVHIRVGFVFYQS